MNRQLLEYGNYLYSKGHNISVMKPVRRRFPENKRESFEMKLAEIGYLISGKRIREIKNLPWIKIECPVRIIPSIDEKYIEVSDITFFSIKSFMPFLERLNQRCGKKVMRACSIWFAEKIKSFPEDIHLIANSSLIKKLLEERLKKRGFFMCQFCEYKNF